MTNDSTSAAKRDHLRVRIFLDFWNFELARKQWNPEFQVDWKLLGPWLAEKAAKVYLPDGGGTPARYDGMNVYLSHDPGKSSDDSLRRWASNVLDRFPGVEVVLKERRQKNPPKCPACHEPIATCPFCKASTKGTVEKGIDTAIVTDMIRLAWADSWDLAVLLSADRDFVPAVEFLNQRGLKVIHAGFPPQGSELAKKCWASIDLRKHLHEVARK